MKDKEDLKEEKEYTDEIKKQISLSKILEKDNN